MQLFLVNYDTHYEIEQLTRMFFKELTVEKSSEVPQLPQQDYILIEKTDSGFEYTVDISGKTAKSNVLFDPNGPKEEMQLCLGAYRLYESATGSGLPWGVLTGVRPVRLMRNLYKAEGDLEKVKTKFRKDYLVSEEKIDLCTNVFNIQKPVIDSGDPKDYSLY
ncbi:MAG: hypothetical protein J6K80_05675, partial [Oscillospiraceae bacterium]|nr:hypothetical protein [Oscillospiraceae bacterium]